jgi:ribosomal protein S18 acetylase RimI-like enzyme
MTACVRVRRAVPADGPRILELDRELARFEKLTPPDEAEGRRLLAWIFEEKRLEALVAVAVADPEEESGGSIAGVALFYEGLGTFRARPFLYLEDLVVSEAGRSRGVGEALMAALAREVMARGALRLEWSVLDWNSRAIAFYDRLGARHPTEWVKYALEGDALERVAKRG